MSSSSSRRRKKGRALQLVQKKQAAAVEIGLWLLEVRGLSDPQVFSAVRNEEGKDDIAAEDDESQGERPGQ